MESKAPTTATPVDQLTQDRLARLAARQSGQKPAATGRTTAPTGRIRKRHAAKASRAAAAVLSVGASVGLSAFFHFADANAASNAAPDASASAATATPSAATVGPAVASPAAVAAPAAATAVTSAPVTTNASGLADGTYLGDTATNKWGPVQVQITVSGGTITDVTAVQTPWNRQRSVDINNQATPILASEALTAQSATIDSVSGATYTSKSYKVSLQSAIDQARAAAVQAGAA